MVCVSVYTLEGALRSQHMWGASTSELICQGASVMHFFFIHLFAHSFIQQMFLSTYYIPGHWAYKKEQKLT